MWDSLRAPLERALEARLKDREESVAKALEERRLRDQADTETRLTELERAIRAELAEAGEAVQLELFSTEERGQYERNREDLAAVWTRSGRAPPRTRGHRRPIRRRHGPALPAAVVFLMPARLARG